MSQTITFLHQCFTAFLHQCVDSFTRVIIIVSIAFIVFFLAENLFRLSAAKKPWRSTLLDLQYALLAVFYTPLIYFVISIVFAYLALRVSAANPDAHISPLVFAVQLIAMLFVLDVLIYVRHRIFHTRPVWPFHSIHHSSEEVNWISAVRFHPVESLLESAGEILVFIACQVIGFDPQVISVASLVVGFYNFFIHSNLRWTFGPLRYVLVSPVFHRWHHSDLPAAQDKNFAAMFSCLDLAFGTFYMPGDAQPETLGLSAQEKAAHPRTLSGQLLHPFKKRMGSNRRPDRAERK